MKKFTFRGFTFLDYAVFNDRMEVIEFLEKLGAKKTLPIYMHEVLMGEESLSDVQFTIESSLTGKLVII